MNFSKSQSFLFSLIFFLAGVLIASIFADLKQFHLMIILIFIFCLALIFSFIKNEKIFLIFALSLIIGILRFLTSFPTIDANYIAFYNNQNLVLRGSVCEEPDIRKDGIKLTICSQSIKINNNFKKISGKVLISLPKYPEYFYGDNLEISGFFEKPLKIEEFDYSKYLARYDIYSVCRNPFVKILNSEKTNFFYSNIFKLKKITEGKLNQILSEPYSSFEAGLLIGSRKGIDDNLTNDFKIAGLSHIIAISGYNITIIIVFISKFLNFMDRRKQIFASIIIIIIFVIFVGASAAVVRAGIMGIIGLVAIWSSRKSDIAITLAFTAFLMTIYNPKILVYDIGFQLSFLATVGLVFVSPKLGKFIDFPNYFNVRESLLLTLSAQSLALPIILINFGKLSLISPLSNIIVTPFIPFAMLFGFIGFLGSILSITLGKILMLPALLSLKIMIFLTHICAIVPFASVNVNFLNWIFLIIYYPLVGYWIWRD